MAFMTSTTPASFSIADKASATWKSIVHSFAQYRVYRNTFVELDSMSNRDLNDIGIHRSNVNGIALEAAYGRAD